MYGIGYKDTTYRGILRADLLADKVPFLSKPSVTIKFDDTIIGMTQLNDIITIDRSAVLVLALRDSIRAADRAILQTYLKHLDLPWGLVVNFGKQVFQLRYVTNPISSPAD